MADNVTVGNTSGEDKYVVASDDDGTAQHQYVKMEWGADGTRTPVASGNAAVPIQDGGNTITVDGTVTANIGTSSVLDAIQTAVEAIQTAVELLDNVVADNEAQVDVVSSALPTGAATAANQSTLIGHVDGIEGVLATIDADTGNIATSAALLDDTVFVDDADFTDGTSKGLGIMAVAENTPTTVTDGDMGMLGMDPATRALKVNVENAVALRPQSALAGLATFHSNDLDETEEDVNDGACYLYGYSYANRTTAPLYLHFYNDVAANVSVGTTAPQFIVEIPANATDHIAGHISFTIPIAFDTGLSVAATTDFPDDGSPAGPAANGCIFTAFYFPAA